MSNSSDTVLFVQGIPIDLDRKGLANLFNRAGPVKNARLIPPKNSSYTSTFGFVEFSSQTTAATALQMFNNYKLGTKYLNVSYAQQKTPQDNALSRSSVCSNGRAVSRMSMSNDLNQSSDSDKLSRKSSIGRGSIIHQNQPQRYQRGNYDLSRPFARKVLARQNLSKKTSSKEAFVDAEQPKAQAKAQAKSQAKSVEELTMGELYPVYITHVNTPSNFFVHLITTKEKTANLINNMDNYYRNGLHQENADLDTNLKLEIDDMCAGYLDSFWYRARVIDKWPEKQTYRLSIIDFGDVHELPFDHVTHLSQEFCETKPASIRCKLAEIRPPRGNSEWSQKAIDTMDTLYKQEDALFAKILSIDEFEPCSGRFETIYGIDLIYGGEESIISYFIQNALAIKIEAGVENECELNLYFSKNSAQKSTLTNDQDTLESQSIDEATDEMLNMSSVSLANANDARKREYAHVPKSLMEPNNRTKLFNSVFRVFKKKDMSPAIQLYKCSQVLDVKLVHIEDHLEFYVQPNSRIGDLAHLEACLNQYAKVLVNDATLTNDLTNFQSKTSRFDVVLVLHEAQWKRAVFLERTSTTTLCSMFDYDYEQCASSHDMSFYSFFLVDWGREILVKRKNGHSTIKGLFILPYDQKLTSVGWFALKCKISEHQIKLREKMGSHKINQMRTQLFDQKFNELFKDKVLRMRISQIVSVKNELTATVDLYFLPHQIQHLLKIEAQQIHQLKSNINKSNVNCVQFVLDQIKQFELTENDFTPIRTNNFVKLNAGQTYTVNIQYFDESYESPYFFVCLCKNFAKLEELDGELQKISSDKTQFRYVEDMSELKVNDTLEALFEVDSKWYRVEVRGLKPLDIYFLDFGNSQTITQLVPKTLRYRLKFEADSQIDLFNLDYQAIRCRYESNTENKVSQFLEQISQIEDFEAGFELTVLESDPDSQQQQQQQDSYLVTLDQDHKHKHHKQEPKIEEEIEEELEEEIEEELEEEIEEKQEEGKASIQLETGSVIDEVSFVHIESVSEFYVQTQDTLRLFIDFQAKIQRLLELMLSNKSSQENRQELFKKGDFVFGKFLSDMNWYRAVIINIEEKSSEKSEFSDLANDGRLYDVYFLDYGNKQENLASCLLYSFDSVKQLNKHLNLMPVSELNSIIEMPFQAICCQLVEKKNNTRNNEVLKSLLLECLNFSIKIGHTSKQKILHNLEIDKYLVYLSTDGKCLQDQFEDELKVEKSLIKPNGVYECKLSNLDKDIYVNLIDQVDEFLKLETLLTSDEKIGSKWRTDATPNLTDLVLAKYVLDEQTSAWCRARITNKINNVFDVFFIDYGNESLHLALQDLAPLGPLYSLSKYPPFAHKIQLHKIQIDLDKHGQYLGEFLSENFKIKVLSVEQEELCCCLVVELWDTSMSKCLNAIIGDETFSDKIEQTHVQHLYLANKATELKVNVNYAFMDDLLKPFYFCLSDDLALRSQLDTQLNHFYSTNDVDAPDFILNAYIAVHSDNSWYRAQIKQMLDTNSIFVFYIDYGFYELIELTEQIKKQKLRKLHAKFYQYPKFVFGAALLNPMAAKADSYELINFESNDNQTLRQTLEDYFTASNSEQFDLVILCKLSSTCLSQSFVPNEDYYGIEMYNADAMCLNEMIVASKQKKPAKPASIRLTMEHIAKQKPLSDQYCVFARAPDHFYVYNEERVLQVQVKTQETCANILQQLQQYEESQEEEKIQVDDLVYAKYDDDETWYRCRVTNYDRESGKFELFYLDFGNIEIVSGSDVLTGWSEHHLQPFVSYEPQAYKCRLYGLANKEYSLEEKNKFKQFTSDKVFDVSFIKVNADGVNEVGLQIGDKSETNVHMFCIGQGIAGFDSFDTILKSKRTSEENKFYINLLSGF